MSCLSQIILGMKYLVLRKHLFEDNVHLSKMYASVIKPLHLCCVLKFFDSIFPSPQLSENFSCVTYETIIKSLCLVVKLIASFGYFHGVGISACFWLFIWGALGVREHTPNKTSAETFLFHNGMSVWKRSWETARSVCLCTHFSECLHKLHFFVTKYFIIPQLVIQNTHIYYGNYSLEENYKIFSVLLSSMSNIFSSIKSNKLLYEVFSVSLSVHKWWEV